MPVGSLLHAGALCIPVDYIAGELAELCGRADRYCGTPACSTEPTGLDCALASGMEYSGISHHICWCTRYTSGPHMPSLSIPYHIPVHHLSQLALCCMLVSHHACRLPHMAQQAHLLSHYPCQSTGYACRPHMPSLSLSYPVLVHHPSQLAPFCMPVTHHTYQAPPHGSATNAGHSTRHLTAILLAPEAFLESVSFDTVCSSQICGFEGPWESNTFDTVCPFLELYHLVHCSVLTYVTQDLEHRYFRIFLHV